MLLKTNDFAIFLQICPRINSTNQTIYHQCIMWLSQNGSTKPFLPNEGTIYTKYVKMFKIGLTIDAIKLSLKKWRRSKSRCWFQYASYTQNLSKVEDENKAKILKLSPWVDAVRHALRRDGKDKSMMSVDPEKSLESQQKSSEAEDGDTGPPLKEDPKYEK